MSEAQLRPCNGCDKSCINDDNRFKNVSLAKGNKYHVASSSTGMLLCLLSGTIAFRSPQYGLNTIRANNLTMLHVGTDYEISATEQSEFIIIRMYSHINICHTISPVTIKNILNTTKDEFHSVAINDAMRNYLDTILMYLRNDVKCYYMTRSKLMELFVIFRYFYSIEDIVKVFYQMLESDFFFKNLVVNNHKNAKNVEQLAELCGYGLSNFKLTFKRVFNQTPYKWMQENIATDIRAALNDSSMPIKEIASIFNFADQSHLTAYCKKHFGATPLKIRRG